ATPLDRPPAWPARGPGHGVAGARTTAETFSSPAGSNDGFEDSHVASAAAQVTGKGSPDIVQRRVGCSLEQAHGREHHARRADAALGAPALDKGGLYGVEPIAVGNAFDGRNARARDVQQRNQATVDELTVNEDRAGPAFSLPASLFRAGETEFRAQHIE